LLALNQPLMDRCLKFPSRTPAYRQDRSHAEFVSPLPLTADTVKQALRAVWGAVAAPTSWPAEESARLVRDCYSQADWNLRL
jgi:lipoate---protein ligase